MKNRTSVAAGVLLARWRCIACSAGRWGAWAVVRIEGRRSPSGRPRGVQDCNHRRGDYKSWEIFRRTAAGAGQCGDHTAWHGERFREGEVVFACHH